MKTLKTILFLLLFSSIGLYAAVPNTPDDIIGPLPICSGSSNTFFINQTGGADGFTWEVEGTGWSFASATTSGVDNILTAGPNSCTISVWAFNVDGNSGTFTTNIHQLGEPGVIQYAGGYHCTSATMSYWIDPVVMADDYHWSVAGTGWTISSSSGTICDVVGGTGNAILSVWASNSCDSSSVETFDIIPKTAPTQINATLSGPHCAGTSNTYTVDPVVGATSYSWWLESDDSGWTATSSTTTAFVVSSGTATQGPVTIYAAANNDCGSSSTISKTMNPLAGPLGLTVDPSGDHCLNTSKTYTVIPVEHANSYQWWFSGGTGWSASSSTMGYIIVTSSTLTIGDATVSVAAVNDCGTSATYTTDIEIVYAPATPNAITPPSVHCLGQAATYTVDEVSQASSYLWDVNNPNWSVSGNSQSVDITSGAGSATITVFAVNDCGVSSPTTITASPAYSPVSPTITAPDFHCYLDTVTYEAYDDPWASSWMWYVEGDGWSGSSRARTCDIAAGEESGTISVVASGDCGTSSTYTIEVTPKFLPIAPERIYTPPNHCNGEIKSYACTPVENAISYTWVIDGYGWVGGTSDDNYIDIRAGSEIATLTVYANTECGRSQPTTMMLIPGNVPSMPHIDKPTQHCTGTMRTYSATSQSGAASYTWQLVNNPEADILWEADQLVARDINFTAGSESATVSVYAQNACGISTVRVEILNPDTPPVQPGTIMGPNVHCEGSVHEYSIDEVPNTIIYRWDVAGDGWEAGTSNTAECDFLAGEGTAVISVIAINSCGESIAQTLTVMPDTLPKAPTGITVPTIHCEGTTRQYSVVPLPGADSYEWNLTGTGWNASSSTMEDINITAGPGTAVLTVNAVNACGSGPVYTMDLISIPLPSSEFTIDRDTVYKDEFVNITYTGNAGAGAEFNWDFDGGTAEPGGDDKGPHTVMWYENPGLRTVKLIVIENGCPSEEKLLSVYVRNETGVNEQANIEAGFDVIPNPSEGQIKLKLESAEFHEADLEIVNSLGRTVYSLKLNNIVSGYSKDLNLSTLPSGSYYVKIKANDKQLVKKLMIVK